MAETVVIIRQEIETCLNASYGDLNGYVQGCKIILFHVLRTVQEWADFVDCFRDQVVEIISKSLVAQGDGEVIKHFISDDGGIGYSSAESCADRILKGDTVVIREKWMEGKITFKMINNVDFTTFIEF